MMFGQCTMMFLCLCLCFGLVVVKVNKALL